MGEVGSEDSLRFSFSSSEEEGFSGEVEMVEGGGVFLTGEVAALEVEQLFLQDFDDVFDFTAVDADFFGSSSVLEGDADEGFLDFGVASVHVAELFHIFAH